MRDDEEFTCPARASGLLPEARLPPRAVRIAGGLGGRCAGGLNFPTAVVASRDLRHWYKLCLNGSGYSRFVEVAAQGGTLFAATGSELLVFALEDVEAAFAGESLLRPYGARLDRVRGALFLLGRPARA